MCVLVLSVVREQGKPHRSKPYRFRTFNGSYVTLETEWLCFVNPWTKRIDSIIGQHRVLKVRASGVILGHHLGQWVMFHPIFNFFVCIPLFLLFSPFFLSSFQCFISFPLSPLFPCLPLILLFNPSFFLSFHSIISLPLCLFHLLAFHSSVTPPLNLPSPLVFISTPPCFPTTP